MPAVPPLCRPADMPRVAAQVTADENAAKLDNCKGPHRFLPVGQLTESGRLAGADSKTLMCVRCYGVVTEDQARWYVRGFKHGRR